MLAATVILNRAVLRRADQRANRPTSKVEASTPRNRRGLDGWFVTKQEQLAPAPSPSVVYAFEEAQNRSNPSPAPTPAPDRVDGRSLSSLMHAQAKLHRNGWMPWPQTCKHPPKRRMKSTPSGDLDLGDRMRVIGVDEAGRGPASGPYS